MARDVHDAIEKLAIDFGKMSLQEAQAFIKKLESQRRYSADVWS